MLIKLEDIAKLENGAQFFNADLHIHSFGASHDVKDSAMTPEAIVDEAVKLGIQILAITDHNSDANTAKSIDYAQKYTGQLLVLAGVEVTTANGHLLVYFDPQKRRNLGNLLARINLQGEPGEQNTHTTMSMADVINVAESLEGLCVAAHIDRNDTGFEKIDEGYPNWKRDILMSSGLFGLEFDDPANLNWYSLNDDKTPAGTERKKIAQARSTLPKLAGRAHLARVQGSDAHSMKAFTAIRAGKIHTRIKLDQLTFDAFRTALIDAEARVLPVASIPKSFPRVLGMHITGGFLDSETYRFSDNLNCFIGGRGTGKSSALKTLAHGLGVNEELEEYDTCPGTVEIYCEDANGILYRYDKTRGTAPIVKAKADGGMIDVPVNAFRVEYYRQGDLAEVAKDPLKNPALLQEFLDRHLMLDDLLLRQTELENVLRQNSAQLIPLEGSAGGLSNKQRELAEVNKKVELAEAGKLKEIAADQGALTNEKTLCTSLGGVRDEYQLGLTLKNFHRSYDDMESSVSPITKNPTSAVELGKIKTEIEQVNIFLDEKEKEIKTRFGAAGAKITAALNEIKKSQTTIQAELNVKITELQKKGLTGSISELQALLKRRSTITLEINKILGQKGQLAQLRKDREKYLAELAAVRAEILERRKAQLVSINQNLTNTIEDYHVYLHYDPAGITDEFQNYILEKMHGTYFHEDAAIQFCPLITPPELAILVLANDAKGISDKTGIDEDWAQTMIDRLRFYVELHALQVRWKSPRPVVSVLTRATPPKKIPVKLLSDGQKHTIMLTIAMLAESNVPLVIDQPEDDLDNAFIFSAVVRVLRTIKERRQVILVTHNANIAVLGDAELLLPMHRKGDGACAFDRGSIDRAGTKKAVLSILEGGNIAFRRRQEIYGY